MINNESIIWTVLGALVVICAPYILYLAKKNDRNSERLTILETRFEDFKNSSEKIDLKIVEIFKELKEIREDINKMWVHFTKSGK